MDHLHNQRKILIVNCYRPPNDCEFISKFEILINWRLQLWDYYSVVVLGDFNYPGIRWIEGSGFTNCLSGEEHSFVNLLTENYFFQLVESPSRINNILDLLITNTPSAIFISRDWSTFKWLWSSIWSLPCNIWYRHFLCHNSRKLNGYFVMTSKMLNCNLWELLCSSSAL